MNIIQRLTSALVILGSLFSMAPGQPASTDYGSPQLVKDINDGGMDSNPTGFTKLNGRVLFFANDWLHGMEPWITDGTQGGTYIVNDTVPTQGWGVIPQTVISTGKMVYFYAWNPSGPGGPVYSTAYGLWRTDGTSDGTVPIPPTPEMGTTVDVRKMVASGQNVYLVEGSGPAGLYKLNGGSFQLLHTWNATEFQNTMVNDILISGNMVYVLLLRQSTLMFELWKTNITTGETVKIEEKQEQGAVPAGPLAAANGLIFLRWQGKLYQSNGEVGNLKEVDAGYSLRAHVSSLVSNGSAVFFTATESAAPDQTNLYMTTGYGSETVKLAEFVNDMLKVINGRVYFSMYGAALGGLLGRTDGTLTGTTIFIPPTGSYSVIPLDVVEVGGKVFFLALTRQNPEVRPVEVWVYDGTPGGVHLLGSIAPGLMVANSGYLTQTGAYLVFASGVGVVGKELVGQKVLTYEMHLPIIQK